MAYYYGWTDEYMESLTFDKFMAYYRGSTILEAEQNLNAFGASLIPHYKPDAAKAKINSLKKFINESLDSGSNLKGSKEIAESIARKLLGG